MERNMSFGTLDRSLGPGCRTDADILDPTGGQPFFDFSSSPASSAVVVPPDIIEDDEEEENDDAGPSAVDDLNEISEKVRTMSTRSSARIKRSVDSDEDDEQFVEAPECCEVSEVEMGVEVSDDDRVERNLREKDKLVFVLSEAGKPIYSR
jgi:hypothetical protein